MAENSSGGLRQRSSEDTEEPQDQSIGRGSRAEEASTSSKEDKEDKKDTQKLEARNGSSRNGSSRHGSSVTIKDEERGAEDGDDEDEDESAEDLPYPGFPARSLYIFRQTSRPRNWCLTLITWPYPF